MPTTEQATQMWCPFRREPINVETRVGAELSTVAANANWLGQPLGGCVGSACMAWRWSNPPTRLERTDASAEARARRQGHCGLAGKPDYAE